MTTPTNKLRKENLVPTVVDFYKRLNHQPMLDQRIDKERGQGGEFCQDYLKQQ